MPPRTIQKLSKFLLKWAESNGLPASVAADANTNLADNEQAGESITGMLIAGWSGAGWWKPCGEVCRPGPGTKHTKANFDKFMACESACRKNKADYLHGFLTPKAAVKALAHAKHAAHAAAAAPPAPSKPPAHTAAAPPPPPAPAPAPPPAAAAAPAHAAAELSTDRHRTRAAPAHAARSAPAAPHLTKYQKLVKWAEKHGLPKSMADNPDDEVKVTTPAVWGVGDGRVENP